MPLYQYKCLECKFITEAVRNIIDRNNKLIISCNNEDNKEEEKKECLLDYKISTPSNPQFKGSGFYETDYK